MTDNDGHPPSAPSTVPYQPKAYWRTLHERGDLSAVGQSGLPATLNRWLYRSWARSVTRLAKRAGLPRAGTRMYEVGAGTGYWVDHWRNLGVTRIDGCDLTEIAVETLNRRYADVGRFITADISELDPTAVGSYDFVDCHNVLLHITDEARFDQALENIGRLVAPGGSLLLAEPILFDATFERPFNATMSSRARPLARYVDGLVATGLRLAVVEPYAVMANNPNEGASRRWYRFWRASWIAVVALCRILPANAHWVGPMLYGLDSVLLRTGAAPSGKLALFHRPL
jgi:SAM-dependent methyltransferase